MSLTGKEVLAMLWDAQASCERAQREVGSLADGKLRKASQLIIEAIEAEERFNRAAAS